MVGSEASQPGSRHASQTRPGAGQPGWAIGSRSGGTLIGNQPAGTAGGVSASERRRRVQDSRVMDPASVTLDSVAALLASLTLLFNRLDAGHQPHEKVDVKEALIALNWALTMWYDDARSTDLAVRDWVEHSRSDEWLIELVRPARRTQAGSADDARKLWKQNLQLRQLLEIYAPELAQVIERAFAQRRTLLDELMTELPRRRAAGVEALADYVGQLHAATVGLNEATDRLRKYLREHFPLR